MIFLPALFDPVILGNSEPSVLAFWCPRDKEKRKGILKREKGREKL